MGDDIHQIEWQNRGLQVQTANQRSLINELQDLLVSHYISSQSCNNNIH
jgi:Exocyst complex component Sec3